MSECVKYCQPSSPQTTAQAGAHYGQGLVTLLLSECFSATVHLLLSSHTAAQGVVVVPPCLSHKPTVATKVDN